MFPKNIRAGGPAKESGFEESGEALYIPGKNEPGRGRTGRLAERSAWPQLRL
jgi:hypothetical protein